MPWNIQHLSLHSALKQTEIEPLVSWKADHANVMLMTITTHTKCKPKATRAAFRVEECLGASRLGHPRITLTYTSIIYLWLAEKSLASAIKSLGLPDLKQPRK